MRRADSDPPARSARASTGALGRVALGVLLASLAGGACATSDPLGSSTSGGDGLSTGSGGPSTGTDSAANGTGGASSGSASTNAGGAGSGTAGSTTTGTAGTGGGASAGTGSSTTSSTSTGGGADCGNGAVDAGEECDDGNQATGDGCDSSCVIECGSNAIKSMATGHCYQLFVAAKHADDAQTACEAWGGAPGLGNLVSIQNSTEQGFVGQLTTMKAWMGGGDEAVEGTYEWYDGTPWIYENWAPNEPNDPGSVENCLFLQVGGKWDDHACHDPRPAYICERRGAGTF